MVTFVDDNKDEIDFDGDVSVSVTDTTMTIDWEQQKSRLQPFIMDLPKIFLLLQKNTILILGSYLTLLLLRD